MLLLLKLIKLYVCYCSMCALTLYMILLFNLFIFRLTSRFAADLNQIFTIFDFAIWAVQSIRVHSQGEEG